MLTGSFAFLFLTLTVVFGIADLDYKLHLTAAVLTSIFALLHVGLVIYKVLKIKSKGSKFIK